jgi:hypothetical protein
MRFERGGSRFPEARRHRRIGLFGWSHFFGCLPASSLRLSAEGDCIGRSRALNHHGHVSESRRVASRQRGGKGRYAKVDLIQTDLSGYESRINSRVLACWQTRKGDGHRASCSNPFARGRLTRLDGRLGGAKPVSVSHELFSAACGIVHGNGAWSRRDREVDYSVLRQRGCPAEYNSEEYAPDQGQALHECRARLRRSPESKDGVSSERTWAAERSRRIRLHFIWNLNLKREHACFGVVARELRV